MATEYLNNKVFEILIVKFQQSKKNRNKYKMFMDDIIATEQRTLKRGKFKKPESWIEAEKTYLLVDSEFQEIQGQLAIAFYTLSQNIVRYAKFNLIDQDDAIQDGVMVCFEKIDRFDPKKGKAFNYMTTCILNAFRQLYRTARNYNELKRKYLDLMQIQMEQQLPASKNKGYIKKNYNFNEML
jgi:DNA-directed RNA polymerase specialized sigma subunit